MLGMCDCFFLILISDGLITRTIYSYLNIQPRSPSEQIYEPQITGFRQISPSKIVIVDSNNHCLGLLNRQTDKSVDYAGYCGKAHYRDGTSVYAGFRYPWSLIDDRKQSGMLLLVDKGNNAIRQVSSVSDGKSVPTVTTFYRSNDLDEPYCIVQHPDTGELYVTTMNKVVSINYKTKTLTRLAGATTSSFGYVDGDSLSSRFSHLREVMLVDEGRKLLVADQSNDMLRAVDLATAESSTLSLYGDGSSVSVLQDPSSLMYLNNSIYIGDHRGIWMLAGKRGQLSRILTLQYARLTLSGGLHVGYAKLYTKLTWQSSC